MALGIVKSPLSKKPYLKSAQAGSVGAAPLDKDVQAQFRSLMAPSATYNQVWGMTETSCVATKFNYPENDDTGSVGRPVPNLEIKYVPSQRRIREGLDIKLMLTVPDSLTTKATTSPPTTRAVKCVFAVRL